MSEFWDRLVDSAEISPSIETLSSTKILLIGAGGLGNDLAVRLAALKIAQLTIVDGDTVSEGNLPHSTLFLPAHVGRYKVEVVKDFLNAKFPKLAVSASAKFVQQADPRHFATHDLIVCAPDNDQTRRWVNYYAVKNGKPAVFLGVSGMKSAEWTGYAYLYRPHLSACFTCFAAGGEAGAESFDTVEESDDIEASRNKCGGDNVSVPMLAPVVGVMSSYAATLILKLLSGVGETPNYTYLDLKNNRMTTLPVKPVPKCAVCGEKEEFEITADFLEQLKKSQTR